MKIDKSTLKHGIWYEDKDGNYIPSGVELIKESDPEKVAAWDRLHDKRKTYRCHRCGAEWKCEYGANKFGTSHEYNGDPDILCQCCGSPTVKEVVMRGTDVTCGELDCANYVNGKCRINYHKRPNERVCKAKSWYELKE